MSQSPPSLRLQEAIAAGGAQRADGTAVPPAEAPTGDPRQPPDDTVKLMDALLMAGLLDSPAGEQLLEAIEHSYDRRIEIEKQSETDDLAALDREAERLAAERVEGMEEARRLRELIDQDVAVLDKLLAEHGKAQQRLRLLQVDLASRRGTYPLRILETRIASQLKLRDEINAHLMSVERLRLEADKAAFELASERRELNRPEYERRVKSLEEQQATAEESRKGVEAMLTALRSLGITRTTGGFMSWAGYVSFAGLGWLVGEYIHRLKGKSEGLVNGLFRLLVNGYETLVARFGFAGAVATLVLLPFVVGGVGFLVLWAADKLLLKLDPNWEKKGAAKRPVKRKEKGPWTLVSGGATEVDRKYYLQWLAKVPVYVLSLFLVSVVAVLFNFGQRGLKPLDLPGALPFQAGLYTFAGVALCILVTGALILYLTRVVEARAAAATTPGAERVPTPLHREFGALGIALLTLTAAGILLALAPSLRGRVGPVFEGLCLAVAVTAGAFVTAFGLIYKGLTRDLDALRREVEQFETEIERFAQLPVLPPLTDDADQYRQDLAALYDEIAKFWREADYWHLPAERLLATIGLVPSETVEPTPERPGALAALRARLRGKPDETRPSLSVDALLEPDLISGITSAALEASSLTVEIERVRERLNQRSGRLRQIGSESSPGASRIDERRAERRLRARQNVAALELEKAAEVGKYKASYSAGKALRGKVEKPFPRAA